MSDPDDDLFGEFEVHHYGNWVTAAREELQGKDPEQHLSWKVADLQGYPYYTSHHTKTVQPIYSSCRSWVNMPLVTVINEDEANATALNHLNHGADGVLFYIPEKSSCSPEKILKKIEWPHCSVSFLLNEADDSFIFELKKHVHQTNYPLIDLKGSLFLKTYPQHPQTINNIVHTLAVFTDFNCLGIYVKHGHPADRISSCLAHAVQIVEQLATSGITRHVSLQHINFAIEIGVDFFIEIATLRALRHLWFQIVRAYGVTNYQPADLCIHGISTPWVNEPLGPHSNMLKGTTATMACIVGGCNALSVQPEKESDMQMRRIARNVPNLLKEESRFDKVADPLAGSYYLESLTDQIISKAWSSFQQKTATP